MSQLLILSHLSQMPKRRKSDPFEKEVLKVLQANVGQGADEMFLLSQLPYIKIWEKTDKLQFQIQFLQLIQQYSNVWESTDVPAPSPENNTLLSSSTTSKAPSQAELDDDYDSVLSI
ncbi:hypothetical protein AVEN_96723-1 [Araneus ventricosus]|uniref:BESS domain-containing protein n=1 Tax=Araneus ventricosus TaxID=182803 RepID=A0A4Y2E7N1_ARAVE|nr:hypothetical protein AVEN_96723-1 [Araneus ventricosus]